MSRDGHARLSQIHTISRSHRRKKNEKTERTLRSGSISIFKSGRLVIAHGEDYMPAVKIEDLIFIFYRDLKKIREYRIREEARKQGNTANRGESTTHRFGRDEHLHHKALHALAGKRRKRCAPPFGGDCAHQLLPRPRKKREGQELVHHHFRSQELANSEKKRTNTAATSEKNGGACE